MPCKCEAFIGTIRGLINSKTHKPQTQKPLLCPGTFSHLKQVVSITASLQIWFLQLPIPAREEPFYSKTLTSSGLDKCVLSSCCSDESRSPQYERRGVRPSITSLASSGAKETRYGSYYNYCNTLLLASPLRESQLVIFSHDLVVYYYPDIWRMDMHKM